jgi:hypothetical protein
VAQALRPLATHIHQQLANNVSQQKVVVLTAVPISCSRYWVNGKGWNPSLGGEVPECRKAWTTSNTLLC